MFEELKAALQESQGRIDTRLKAIENLLRDILDELRLR